MNLEKLIIAFLDKLPKGWKSAIGLLVMIGAQVAYFWGKVSEEHFRMIYDFAVLATGLGLFHKAVTSDTPKPPSVIT